MSPRARAIGWLIVLVAAFAAPLAITSGR